ncbi:MAG: hypothetical protein ACI4V7_09540 [Succinivibrionaceae bacterium]
MEERKIEVITTNSNLPIYVKNHANSEVIYYQYDGRKLVCKTSIRNPFPMVVDLERYEVDEYTGEVTHYCSTNGSTTKEIIHDTPLSSCSSPHKIYKEYYDYDELTIFYDTGNQHQAMCLRKYKDEDVIDIVVNFTTIVDDKKITACYTLPLEDSDGILDIEKIDTTKAFLGSVFVHERDKSGDYIESEYFYISIDYIHLEKKSDKKYLSEWLTSVKDIIDVDIYPELSVYADYWLTEDLTLISTKVIPEHEEIDSEYHEYQQVTYYTNGKIDKIINCKKVEEEEHKYENVSDSEIYIKSTYIETVTQYDINGNIVTDEEE